MTEQLHDPYEKVIEDDVFEIYDHTLIICRRCKRVLEVDGELGTPEEYGVCEPIPEGAKVTKLIV
jgi:hypothetical protein